MNILEELQVEKQKLIEAENNYEQFEESVEANIINHIEEGSYKVHYNGKYKVVLAKPYEDGSCAWYALEVGTVDRGNHGLDPYKISDNRGNTLETSESFFNLVKGAVQELERDDVIESKLEEISSLCKEVYNLRLVKALNKKEQNKEDLEILNHYMENNPFGEDINE